MGGNKNLPKILSFILIFLVMYCCSINRIQVSAAESYPANTIWIEPSNISLDLSSANLGYRFNVTVWVRTTQRCFTWQLKLHFNSTYFEVKRVGYTDGNKSDFFTNYSPLAVSPVLNNQEGYVLHGETLTGTDQRDHGYGSLMWVEFALKAMPPQETFLISIATPYGLDTFLLNSDSETIPLEIGDNAEIKVVGQFPPVAWLPVLVAAILLAIVAFVIWRRKTHA